MLIASRRLGEFLVERRVLSRDALDELLARETAEGESLSHLLIATGLVSEADLLVAVADQIGVPFVDVTDHPIRPDVYQLVPEDVARGYLAVAIDRRPDGRVVVAMEDPTDSQVVAVIVEDIGQPVVPTMAARSQLEQLVAAIYGSAAPDDRGDGEWAAGDLGGSEPVRPAADLTLDDILGQAMAAGATDVYLSAGSAPRCRRQGALETLPGLPVLNGSILRRLVYTVLTAAQREQFERERELESTHTVPGQGRFRLNVLVQRDSVAAVIRAAPPAPPTLDRLGLPETVRHLPDLEQGLIVVTGPLRSGRSTTLAAIVDAINESRACHIVTIEDPIEFSHSHKHAIVNQRQVGTDTRSVTAALARAIRQDPDVILVAGVRDGESVRLLLDAAEAGVLVLCAMSVPHAVDAVERLITLSPSDQQGLVRSQLGTCLQAVVAQQLIHGRQGHRLLAAEVLVGTPTVQAFIREGRPEQLNAAMAAGSDGMQTMEHALARMVTMGQLTVEQAEERCAHPDELRRLVRGSTPLAGAVPPSPPAMPRERLVR